MGARHCVLAVRLLLELPVRDLQVVVLGEVQDEVPGHDLVFAQLAVDDHALDAVDHGGDGPAGVTEVAARLRAARAEGTHDACQPLGPVTGTEGASNAGDAMDEHFSGGAGIHRGYGERYLDALAGIAVNTLGHNHPKLVPALQDQVAKIIHSCNYYHVPNQEKLAAKLVQLSGMTNVFFGSTGLEANEAAIKLVCKFGHDRGIERPEIVVYEKAFHGRSIATLSATGNDKVQKGFGPLVEGFIRVPLNDIAALKRATEGNRNVVAVFFETIQGEGGVNPLRDEYRQQVRARRPRNDWRLMSDEVQC